uniref:Uncharacterized protein n=1 Tax=Bionectria ochroleuca TaxID=29856 RepID=A0A0B7JYY8_BIOOC
MTLPNNEGTPYPKAKSQQTALMDLFLPDFNIGSSTASQIRGGNLIGYTRIICIFALAALLKPYIFQLSDWFLTFFQWTIHTRRYEETYGMIRGGS